MCLKFRENFTNLSTLICLIDDDYRIVFELFSFASNIKRKVCGALNSFLSLKKKIEKRKTHNMFFMLDPNSKTFI